ncbi:MAG: hypothetical protein K8U57_09465 [Planctomycetes bacterium]|nr:hypothetical protein [Planctomycetota bacterium]
MSDIRFSLDMIEVPIPCTVPWDSMRGNDRVRHCGQCKQHVYLLSEMSKEEAEDLIRQKEGKLCVRVYRRPDGSVVTRSCAAVHWSRAVWNAASFVVLGLCSICAFISVPWFKKQYEEWSAGRVTRTMGVFCSPSTTQPTGLPELAPPPREVKTPDSAPKE